jgi:predicted nuclease with TOPRIM domain
VQNSEELSAGLQHKVAVMKDLESDIFVCKNKIQDTINQIGVCEQQQREDHHRAHDIQSIIDRLFKEREELNNRMHHLTKNYDHAVSDVSKERAQLESHHKRHT